MKSLTDFYVHFAQTTPPSWLVVLSIFFILCFGSAGFNFFSSLYNFVLRGERLKNEKSMLELKSYLQEQFLAINTRLQKIEIDVQTTKIDVQTFKTEQAEMKRDIQVLKNVTQSIEKRLNTNFFTMFGR